jgi:hypothetical protein
LRYNGSTIIRNGRCAVGGVGPEHTTLERRSADLTGLAQKTEWNDVESFSATGIVGLSGARERRPAQRIRDEQPAGAISIQCGHQRSGEISGECARPEAFIGAELPSNSAQSGSRRALRGVATEAAVAHSAKKPGSGRLLAAWRTDHQPPQLLDRPHFDLANALARDRMATR